MEKYGVDVNNCVWIVQEKLHGSNISFLFQSNQPVEYFSRNQKITGTNFFDCEDLLQDYGVNILSSLQKMVDGTNSTVRIFGELCGPGIQKGVYYGTKRFINFFDIMINDKIISTYDFENILNSFSLSNYIVPVIAITPTLKDALEFNIRFDSKLSEVKDNICEGVVIKPYYEVFVDNKGSVFYIKHKNDEFKEKQKVKKERTETQYTEEVNQMRSVFLSYITVNRVESVFSKEGEIESHSELGKYIPLVNADAIEDFNRDYVSDEHGGELVDVFTKQELKFIFNSSHSVVRLLKNYL